MQAYPETEPKSHEHVEPIRPGRADEEAPIDSLSRLPRSSSWVKHTAVGVGVRKEMTFLFVFGMRFDSY